jgi:NAD(P)-dependent dehydrogenase (short-subunit alcohol dehydrogenase family)
MANGHPARRLSGGTIMNIERRTVLITGASRGIGKALVDEALRRGAGRIDAGTRGPLVHGDLPTDTDMTWGYEIPKATPESVARAIFDGLERGGEEISRDPMSEALAERPNGGVANAFERQFAAAVQAA